MQHGIDSRIWYAPRQILQNESFPENKKLSHEVRSTALFLLGLMRLFREEYWLQPVDPRDQAPDSRIAHWDHEGNHLLIGGIEVVSCTAHSAQEDVAQFIARTKMRPEQAYPEGTSILCVVDGRPRNNSWQEIHESLEAQKRDRTIFVLSTLSREREWYELARVHPALDTFVKFYAEYDPIVPTLAIARQKRLARQPRGQYADYLEAFSEG